MRGALQAVTLVAVLEHALCTQECPAVVKNASFAPEMIHVNELCMMGRSDFSKGAAPTKISVSGFWGGDPLVSHNLCTGDKDSFKMDCSRLTLEMDSATCACRQIAINKVAGATDLSMHLDFENCTAGAPAPMAVVNMVLRQVPDDQMTGSGSLLEYFDGVCTKPTVAPVSSVVKVTTNAHETAVGEGACEGTPSQTLTKADAATREICSEVCLGLIEKFSPLSSSEDKTESCTGYAYSEDAPGPPCFIYNTPISKINASGPAGTWACWNESGKSSFAEATPAPIDMDKLTTDYLSTIPKLGFNVTASTAEMDTVSSKVAGCFSDYTWIDLKDQDGVAFVPIKASEWDGFLSYVPDKAQAPTANAATDAVGCKMSTRKIYYGGNGGEVSVDSARVSVPVAPAPTECPKVVVHEQYEACTTSEYINAAITATVVPLLCWICVWILYDRCFKDAGKPAPKVASNESMNSTFNSGSGGPTFTSVMDGSAREVDHGGGCDITVVLILALIVAIAAGISASLLAHILGLLLTPICGASSHDLNLIVEGISIATFVACAGAIWFMSTRPTSSSAGPGKDESKYMLLKVKENPGNNFTVLESMAVRDGP